MSTEIGFVDSLGESNETQASFNYPKKVYYDGAKRTNDAAGVNKENQICTYNTLYDLNTKRLLRSASLLVTPTFYKEGTLFSVKPTGSTNGNFTVTRATTATRVNAAGLVELVPYNLFSYSQQFQNTSWLTCGGGPSVFTDNFSTAPNGTTTASRWTAANLNSQVRQNLAIINTTMTISVWMRSNVGTKTATIFINDSAVVSTITITTSWQRFTLTGAVGASLLGAGRCGFSNNSILTTSDYIEVWGAQLVEGTSALAYQMTETRLNIPRLDYSLGSCPNILLEPQRTNFGIQSEDLSSAAWFKGTGVTITADSTISPSGVQNADRVVGATGTGTWASANTLGSATSSLLSNTLYTATIYLRSSTTSSQVTLRFRDQTTGNENQIVCNLTSSWQRFEISRTTGAATTALAIVLTNSTADFFAWGRQVEAGAYATSYIPTTSASVTRNADVISRGNIFTNGLITASGGTWFVDLRNNVPIAREITTGGIYLNTGTISTIGSGFSLRNAGSAAARMTINKVESGTLTNLYTTITDNPKIAIKWNGTTADVFVNGIKQVSATAFTATSMQNLITDGVNRAIQYNSMALFPTPLTDGEMSMLTSGVYTPALAYAQLGLVSESPACLDSSVNALL
jgi:hypothetical protein